MGRFVKGDIVIIPFPFSDLSASKKRPAFVAASLAGNDVILCQITSRPFGDRYALAIEQKDFATGGLNRPSSARPNRLFTADSGKILFQGGQ